MLLATPVQAAGKADKSTTITTCPYTINAPGTYGVAQDLACAGTAIIILADNVTLNLGGHTVSGNGGGEGIYVGRNASVTIQRGTVQGFATGIRLDGALDSKVSNVTVRDSGGFGMDCQGMGMTITGNVCSKNGHSGIHLDMNARDFDQIVSVDPHLHRRPDRSFGFLEVNHHDLPARPEHLLHEREVAVVVFNVMPRIADEEPVNGGIGQEWVVGRTQDRCHVRHLEIANAAVQMSA